MDIYTLNQLGFKKRKDRFSKQIEYFIRIGTKEIVCFECKPYQESDFIIMDNKKWIFWHKDKLIKVGDLFKTIFKFGKLEAKHDILSELEEKYGD